MHAPSSSTTYRRTALTIGFATTLAALGIGYGGWCVAQSTPNAPADATAAGVPLLQEVVVTALKRSTPEQDVPVSMSVIGVQQLQQNGVEDFRDILREIPGVSFTETGVGQSNYSIRGISTNASSPTVGIYLDGVSLVSLATVFNGAIDPVLFDMSRVERAAG